MSEKEMYFTCKNNNNIYLKKTSFFSVLYVILSRPSNIIKQLLENRINLNFNQFQKEEFAKVFLSRRRKSRRANSVKYTYIKELLKAKADFIKAKTQTNAHN